MATTLPICILLSTPLHDIIMHKYYMRAIHITCKLAVLLPFTHPIRHCTERQVIPPPTSQTTSRRSINLNIITFDLFLNYLDMATTNIDRGIEE